MKKELKNAENKLVFSNYQNSQLKKKLAAKPLVQNNECQTAEITK